MLVTTIIFAVCVTGALTGHALMAVGFYKMCQRPTYVQTQGSSLFLAGLTLIILATVLGGFSLL